MAEKVWVTGAMVSLESTYQFAPWATYYSENRAATKASASKYMKAQRLEPSERKPDEAELLQVTHSIDPLPDMLSDEYLIVSDRWRETAQQFDLGSTAFDPVVLYGFRRKYRFELDYNYLNITQTKASVVLEKCKDIRPRRAGNWNFGLPESQIAVNKVALSGVDLWMEPILRGAVFMSDALYTALNEQKLLKRTRFAKCTIID
ncbi:hypothetical protein [Yoonia sp. SDW83-1]|uniref:hypothetical protein n=1 Tax=Yoonia sp. SDW83-1 TaxID=3366945 RepID=UPI00398C5093